MHKPEDLDRFEARFSLDLTATEAARFIKGKIHDAANKWTTVGYDQLQKIQNGIM